MDKVYAQSINIGTNNPINIKGPLIGINNLSDVINVILAFLFPFIGIVLLFEFLMAGYTLIRSDGSPEHIKEGKYRIVYSILGFFLLIVAFLVARLTAYILGFGGELF